MNLLDADICVPCYLASFQIALIETVANDVIVKWWKINYKVLTKHFIYLEEISESVDAVYAVLRKTKDTEYISGLRFIVGVVLY